MCCFKIFVNEDLRITEDEISLSLKRSLTFSISPFVLTCLIYVLRVISLSSFSVFS